MGLKKKEKQYSLQGKRICDSGGKRKEQGNGELWKFALVLEFSWIS